MAKENVRKFYDAATGDGELKQALLAVPDKPALVALANEWGFDFSLTEYNEFLAEDTLVKGELSESELEQVRGGEPRWDWFVRYRCSTCGWDDQLGL